MFVLCFLIITVFINASEDKIINYEKVINYEQKLTKSCVDLNNALDRLLLCKEPEERTLYFNQTLQQEIYNFEALFLQAPPIKAHPLGKSIEKAFSKIIKPLQNIQAPISTLPEDVLKKISLKRDIFFETMFHVYYHSHILTKDIPLTVDNKLTVRNKNKPIECSNKLLLSCSLEKCNKGNVKCLNTSIENLNTQINAFLSTLEGPLAGPSMINRCLYYFSSLMPKDVNDEYEEDEQKKSLFNERLLGVVKNIEKALEELKENLNNNFSQLMDTEIKTGILHQIQGLYKETKTVIEQYEKTKTVIGQYKINNKAISDQNKLLLGGYIKGIKNLIEHINNLKIKCTKENIEKCQTKTVEINFFANDEEESFDKKIKSFLEWIALIRLFIPRNETCFQALKGSIQQRFYEGTGNFYNGILQTAGQQTAQVLINKQNQLPNNVQSMKPALNSVIDVVRNPQAVATTILTQGQNMANGTIVQVGEGCIEYTQYKNKINKIHNTLTPESYFKALAYAWVIHSKNIGDVLPVHKLRVNEINCYTDLYAKTMPEEQKDPLLITSATAQALLKEKSIEEERKGGDNLDVILKEEGLKEKGVGDNVELVTYPSDQQDKNGESVIPDDLTTSKESNSLYAWIKANKNTIESYLNDILKLKYNLSEENEQFLKARNDFCMNHSLITQMPDDCALKDILSLKDDGKEFSILDIAFLTIPNACANYMKERNYKDVDCKTLWKDTVFLDKWQEEIKNFKQKYCQQISDLNSSLKSYDKFRLWLEQVKKTELIQPFYHILKEVISFFIEFSKAMLNINNSEKISFVKEQKESFWRAYRKCEQSYCQTLKAIEKLEDEIKFYKEKVIE